MWPFKKKMTHPLVSLEEQLRVLDACGISLAPGKTVDDLLKIFPRESLEGDPYRGPLCTMGSEEEEEPYEPLSHDIWHFDTECIEHDGNYVTIANRFRMLAGGGLPLEGTEDHVDLDERVAWLRFRLDGQEHHWKAEVNGDWTDPSISSRFAELLAKRDIGKRFTYLDLGGQDCLMGCATPEQLAMQREKTGLDFQWLT